MTTANISMEHRRLTLEEYRALPEGPPRYELDKGKLIPMVQPTSDHQDVVLVLGHLLFQYARTQGAGRVFMEPEVYLADDRAYIPDVAFLAAARSSLLNAADGRIYGAPDLVIEVTSARPARDRVDKFQAYFENGVAWYWVVDPPALMIDEYHFAPGGYERVVGVVSGQEFKPALFPGLVIDLAKLLKGPAPATP